MYGNLPNLWDRNLKKDDRLRFAVNTMTRMRTLEQDGAIDFSFKNDLAALPSNLIPWYLYPAKPRKEFILSGHWSAIGIQHYARGVTLDSGCVWGMKLSAYSFDDKKIISIDADQRDLI